MSVSLFLFSASALLLAASVLLPRWQAAHAATPSFPFRPLPDTVRGPALQPISQRREERVEAVGSAGGVLVSRPAGEGEAGFAHRQFQRQAVGSLLSVLRLRDLAMAHHAERTAALADTLASVLGLDAERREGLRLAALAHDIGQIQVPAELLTRPRRLSTQEFALIRLHPEAGYQALREIDFCWPVAEIVRQHHENVDGSGYPRQLQGEDILWEARILRVADSCAAMLAHRPFRRALHREQVMAILEEEKGRAFDAQVAAACLELLRCREEEALFAKAG